MFVEKRKAGKNTKYYLVHSYRENKEIKKIRRFLGSNLSIKELEKLSKRAEELIKLQIEDIRTNVFDFSVSSRELEVLNKYSKKIEILHLNKKEWELFTEDFVYNTNAIEGSTVARGDVHKILEKKNVTNPEELEAKGVSNAVDYIRTTKEDLSLDLLKKLHKLCFDGTKSFAGKFRDVEVVIGDRFGNIVHRGTPVKELDSALQEYVLWYAKNKNKFKPLVLAAIVHNQFEDIHPFQDGNGRVGRLLLNFILIKNNHPPINILLEDRSIYYATLQAYHKNHDLKPTLEFLTDQYKKMIAKVTTRKQKK